MSVRRYFGEMISTQRNDIHPRCLDLIFGESICHNLFCRQRNYEAMSSSEDSLISADSMPSLIGGDEDNLFDVEPYIQADPAGLARDADRGRWTDLVVAELATYFHGEMAAVLGTWASAVYSLNGLRGVGNNFAADYLSRERVFQPQGLVQRTEYIPRLVWEHVPHAPAAVAAVVHRPGLQALAMGDASLNGMGEVMFDLNFHHRLTWRIDNLGAYHEYVDDTVFEHIGDTAGELSENGSEGSEDILERIDL